MTVEILNFISVKEGLPTIIAPLKDSGQLLVRGWEEKEHKYYVYALAAYKADSTLPWRTYHGDWPLWFEPVEWAKLPRSVESGSTTLHWAD